MNTVRLLLDFGRALFTLFIVAICNVIAMAVTIGKGSR